MLIAELTASFQWGLLLVADINSKDHIPSWSSPDDRVTAVDSALVVRIMPDDEGPVHVSVVDNHDEAQGVQVFSGRLKVASRVLQVGDGTGSQTVQLGIDSDEIEIDVFLDEPVEAEEVFLAVRAIGPAPALTPAPPVL